MKKKDKTNGKLAPVQTVKLAEYTKECILAYGTSVIEDRALPDFRDGLKPVARRSLWAAFKAGVRSTTPHKKSARIVGDTIGKYHPHGDTACYGAIVTNVNSPMPLFEGSGNWGGPMDEAAAYRYTNVRLSRFGDANFFHPDYIPVAKLIPNFDGTEVEPLLLPSLVPNLLLNGAEGIAVGTTVNIPPFEFKGVAMLVKALLLGNEITAKDCLKHLVFNYKYGGIAYLAEKDYKDDLMRFFKTGVGSAVLEPRYDWDAKKRQLNIKDAPRGVNLEKALDRAANDDRVKFVTDRSGKKTGINVEVQLKPSIPQKELRKAVEHIIDKYFTGVQNFRFNITARKYDEASESTSADFASWSVIQFLQEWVKWRIELEKESLRNRIKNITEEIHKLNLLIKAADHLDVIFKGLKRKDTEEFIAKGLKISMDDTDYILSKPVRSLKVLSVIQLRADVVTATKHKKELEGWLKSPKKKIVTDLIEFEAKLNKAQAREEKAV